MNDMTLWGFDGSTYVRTVKMLLAEKHVTNYRQIPLNVLKGEAGSNEHLTRHPFGKVPVLDHAGLRILPQFFPILLSLLPQADARHGSR